MNRTAKLAIGVLGAIVLVLGGVAAYAAIPSSTGVFTACMTKSSGTIRLVEATETCRSSEQKVSWNQAGQPGTPGQDGQDGAPGEDGQDGAPGTNGTNGVSGYSMNSRFAIASDHIGLGSYTVSIFCPNARVALGGGGRARLLNGDRVVIQASHPQGSFGWDVTFTPLNGQPFPPVQLDYTLWVSCAAINN